LETKNNTPSREDEEICNSTRERIEEEEEKINDLSIDSDSTAQPPARKRKRRHNSRSNQYSNFSLFSPRLFIIIIYFQLLTSTPALGGFFWRGLEE
jgi:hypothetical protein